LTQIPPSRNVPLDWFNPEYFNSLPVEIHPLSQGTNHNFYGDDYISSDDEMAADENE
jgi:hypothetical protein